MWSPDSSGQLSGELKGKTIRIYESEIEKAKRTLRHEIIDYLISRAIEPYSDVANRLIRIINEDAYKRKERVVETIADLIERSESSRIQALLIS